MSNSPYTNIAFISYKREDEEWAKWLQKKLEHYGKNGADCYSKNGHAVTVLTRQS